MGPTWWFHIKNLKMSIQIVFVKKPVQAIIHCLIIFLAVLVLILRHGWILNVSYDILVKAHFRKLIFCFRNWVIYIMTAMTVMRKRWKRS